MSALLTLAIYVAPFLTLGIVVRYWLKRQQIDLGDVQAEGDPNRRRSRFLLGIWRHDRRD